MATGETEWGVSGGRGRERERERRINWVRDGTSEGSENGVS